MDSKLASLVGIGRRISNLSQVHELSAWVLLEGDGEAVFSKCGPQMGSISITWELVTNRDSQTLPGPLS